MKTENLSVDLLRLDAGTQNRVKINEDVVEDYVELIAASNGEWPFPPVDVFHDGVEGNYMAGDGFHRILAAQRAKRASIPCTVHSGTATDARIFGMTANDQHGLRMTRADKRACVEWILDNGGKMTQEEIAAKTGVTTRTVRFIVSERKSKLSESSRKISGSNTKARKSSESNEQPDSDPFLDEFPDKDEAKKKPSKPGKQFDRSYWYKQWEHSIGPLVRLVDKIAHGVGEAKSESHKCVQDHLGAATEEMMEWLGVKK